MSVSYNGYKNYTLTVENENGVIGYPSSFNAEGKLISTQSGQAFMGVCTGVNGDYASLQTDGYIELPYAGTAPEYGVQYLVAAGSGSVQTGTAAAAKKAVSVVMIDTTNKVVGIIL